MNTLAPLQERAVTLLCEGVNGADVARQLDVSPHTVYRWQHKEQFKDALQAKRDTLRAELHHKALSYGNAALEKLYATMTDPTTSKRISMDCAIALLDRVDKTTNIEFAERLKALECLQQPLNDN